MRKIAVIIFLAAALVFPQFGRNKVQYKNYEWYYLTTPDFVIYYPRGYEHLVEFARRELEKGLDQLSNDFSYTPQDRISIVIYPTRFDFQETNVTPSILPEGVGGFTEMLKNRVVVPFDGNWEHFRHVLAHELTHAFTFDFLYGSAPAGVLSLNRVFHLPLWMAEGLSEFESLGWDAEADMYLRDAVLNDYIRPPDELGGFLVYKEGQSLMHYIAERWGRKKLGELLAKGRIEVTQDRVVRSALGISLKDFYDDWKLWARRRYYPQIEGHNLPDDFAEPLTDHEKQKSYFNVQPAYNPQKDQIAFISDKNAYIDIFLVDVPTKIIRRIEKGERSGEAQSFHPFDSRMSFSPDGKFLAHSVKLGECDGIAILDVRRKKRVRTLKFIDDGIREISSPCWSPDGEMIVFAGLHDGQRDIFITDTAGITLNAITDDIYDDNYPSFSPDCKKIAFSSDRPIEDTGNSDRAYPEEYGRYNIFMMDINGDSIEAITTDGAENRYPIYSPVEEKIAFTSQKNGVANIYIADMEFDTIYAITNLVCASYTPVWSGDGKKIAFAGFWYGGWDIYVFEAPFEPESLKNFDTAFEYVQPAEDTTSAEGDSTENAENKSPPPMLWGELSKYRFHSDEGDTLPPRKYRPQFSADLAMMNFGYSTYYGLEGSTILMLSDILGNHQILIATDLYQSIENSNFYCGYGYLTRRTDFYFTAFHYKYFFVDNLLRLFSDRYYGGSVMAAYPLSQFSRAEFSAGGFAVDRYFYDPPYDDEYSENFLLNGALVFDNSLWGYTGPVMGSRRRIDVEIVPKMGRNSKSYSAIEGDFRKYYHLGGGYSFALRLAGGYSTGRHPKTYYLGGTYQWLNYHIATNNIYSISDIYLSKMVFPMRGYDYFELSGNSYALFNFEFRYPFVENLSLGFPPITIQGINGALFTDIGAVASKPYENFRGINDGKLQDIKMSVGFGMRSWIWLFSLHYDIAWATDLQNFSPKPKYYLSLGLEY